MHSKSLGSKRSVYEKMLASAENPFHQVYYKTEFTKHTISSAPFKTPHSKLE